MWYCLNCKSSDVSVGDEKFKVIFEWFPQKAVELEYEVPRVIYCKECDMHFCHPDDKKKSMNAKIEEYKRGWRKRQDLEADYETVREIVSSYSSLNQESPGARFIVSIFIRSVMMIMILLCWVNAFVYRNKEIRKDLPWLYKIFKNDDIIDGIIEHFSEREKELVNKLTGRA